MLHAPARHLEQDNQVGCCVALRGAVLRAGYVAGGVSVHGVLSRCRLGAGHALLMPVQRAGRVQGSPDARQSVPFAAGRSTGQVDVLPVHL